MTKSDELSTSVDPITHAPSFLAIDHIALAVQDLEAAIHLFRDVLGFKLMKELHVQGKKTGMRSAEFDSNGIRFVLCSGTEPESQVSQLVINHGVGVAHIAFAVDDVEKSTNELKRRGLTFDTNVISGPGLTQAFSSRSTITGLSIELIKREETEGFLESNVQELFEQLEHSGKY